MGSGMGPGVQWGVQAGFIPDLILPNLIVSGRKDDVS